MREGCSLVWSALVGLFRSRASLLAEILVLRHQLNIQRRHLPKRRTFSARGPPNLCCAVSIGANCHKCTGDCEAGDRHKMAPCRVQIVLALEVATPWWQAYCAAGRSAN